MILLLMDSLLMTLFMFLTFKALLLTGVLVDASWIAARKLVLGDHQVTVNAGLGARDLGLRRGTGKTLSLISSPREPVSMRSMGLAFRKPQGFLQRAVGELFDIVLR